MAGKSRGSADKMMNVIIAIVIIAVLGLAGYAVYDKLSANILNEAIANGEKEATVGYLAEQSGMSVEDYLAQYGISGLDKNATEEEMTDAMTVETYLSYIGAEMEDLTTQYHLSEAPALDANWGEIRKGFTMRNIVGDDDGFAQFKEIYGLDDSVTIDTPLTEAEPIIEESIKRMQEEAANATEAPATEAPAEGETAEATEAPAEDAAAAEAPAEDAAE